MEGKLSSKYYDKYSTNASLFNLCCLEHIIIRVKPNHFVPEILHNGLRTYCCDSVGIELTKRNEIIKRISCFALRLDDKILNHIVRDIWLSIYTHFYEIV